MIYEQEALDYMSYAISKQIKPRNFLTTSNKEAVQAGARLIFGIIEASENSFTINLIFETESHLCLPLLVELAQKQMEPVLIDTAFNLCGWFSDTRNNISADEIDSLNVHLLESEEQKAALRQMANDQSLKTKILKIIESANDLNKDPQLIHALRLAGKLDIAQAHPVLIDLLTDQNSTLSLNELKHVIIAISLLSVDEEKTVATLINFANRLVNVQERQALSKQKQPVAEENAKEVKTYWEILRAMGNLFTNSSAIFLVNALNDYAPDMRWCALESIVEIYDKNKQVNLPKSIEDILQTALKDPSPMVQLAALLGATKLNRANLIKDIISLINAQENTVSKQALTSLSYMAQNVGQLTSERNKYISERNKLELLLMSIADGVVVCDADNRVQIVNAAATAIFAKDAKELVGKPLIFCTEGPDSPAICRIVQEFTDSLSPSSLEPVIQQMHLGELVVRLHISPIILNGEFLGSVIIMHDITRQAELEKMKTEFIANVSHELRTPITSIKSYVDTLCNHGEN